MPPSKTPAVVAALAPIASILDEYERRAWSRAIFGRVLPRDEFDKAIAEIKANEANEANEAKEAHNEANDE